ERSAAFVRTLPPSAPALALFPCAALFVAVAHGAVCLVRVRAHARGRVARPRHVTLVEGRAGDGGGRAPAAPALAGLARGAGVVVVARAGVSPVRVRAHARVRVARLRVITLVERGA